jgi:hypothetical protein
MTHFTGLSAVAVLFAVHATPAIAQRATGRADPNCTYQTCALGLAPVWNGLEVTRGDAQTHVATLGFFIPEDISHVFAEDAEARDVARDAFRIRQVAAALTDAGAVLAVTGLARALFRRDWDGLSTGLTLAGGASLAGGIPAQFAADGALSRAVWLFNRRFAR